MGFFSHSKTLSEYREIYQKNRVRNQKLHITQQQVLYKKQKPNTIQQQNWELQAKGQNERDLKQNKKNRRKKELTILEFTVENEKTLKSWGEKAYRSLNDCYKDREKREEEIAMIFFPSNCLFFLSFVSEETREDFCCFFVFLNIKNV